MRLTTELIDGDVHRASQRINDAHVAKFVLSLQYISGVNKTYVTYRTECYPDYLYLCERLHMFPVSVEVYFK